MENVAKEEIRSFFDSLVDGELNLIRLNPEQVENAAYVNSERDGDGNIIGISGVCLQRFIPLPYLFVLVRRPFWNNGIGSRLVKKSIKFAISKYHMLFLSTLDDEEHKNAIRMYKKCGFVHFYTPDKHYWMVTVRQ